MSSGDGFMGETFVNGQGQNVWCDSQKALSLTYHGNNPLPTASSPACYLIAGSASLIASTAFPAQVCEGNTSLSNKKFTCTFDNLF